MIWFILDIQFWTGIAIGLGVGLLIGFNIGIWIVNYNKKNGW
jgi:hypothetical protein